MAEKPPCLIMTTIETLENSDVQPIMIFYINDRALDTKTWLIGSLDREAILSIQSEVTCIGNMLDHILKGR